MRVRCLRMYVSRAFTFDSSTTARQEVRERRELKRTLGMSTCQTPTTMLARKINEKPVNIPNVPKLTIIKAGAAISAACDTSWRCSAASMDIMIRKIPKYATEVIVNRKMMVVKDASRPSLSQFQPRPSKPNIVRMSR